jgi:D-amino-acid dehydrogenase
MRVIVAGGGVVGVTTAYFLALDGHEVELLDAGELGNGASGVNAGLIVPGDSVLWSTPQVPGVLARTLAGRGAGGIAVRRSAGMSLLPWGLRFLRECLPARNAANTRAAHALSRYSLEQLTRVTEQEALAFDYRRDGMVFLFRDPEARAAGVRARAELRGAGEEYELLSGEELVARHPAFAGSDQRYPFLLYNPGAASGNCRAFTVGLAEKARSAGVRIREHLAARSVERSGGRVSHVGTDRGRLSADAVVIAAGVASRRLARTAGVRLPVQPARGYAVTVRIADQDRVPLIGGVAEDEHVAWSRTATHVRISSSAEFCAVTAPAATDSYDGIRRVADVIFGGALDWDTAAYHVGYRPMTPAGLPFIGPTPVGGLFVNTGHSHLGWTQACGSARLLADQLSGRIPDLDPAPYALAAWGRPGGPASDSRSTAERPAAAAAGLPVKECHE